MREFKFSDDEMFEVMERRIEWNILTDQGVFEMEGPLVTESEVNSFDDIPGMSFKISGIWKKTDEDGYAYDYGNEAVLTGIVSLMDSFSKDKSLEEITIKDWLKLEWDDYSVRLIEE